MYKFFCGLIAVCFAIVTSFAFAKPEKEGKFIGPYYFQVTNNVAPGSETSAILAPTASKLTAPDASWSCSNNPTRLCALSFEHAVLTGSGYVPADAMGNPLTQAQYGTYESRRTKAAGL